MSMQAPDERQYLQIAKAARGCWLEECAHIADNVGGQAEYIDGDRIYRNGWRAAAERIAQLIRAQKAIGR